MKPHTMGLLFYPIVQLELNMYIDDSNAICYMYNCDHDYLATYSYVASYVLLVDIQIIFTVFHEVNYFLLL